MSHQWECLGHSEIANFILHCVSRTSSVSSRLHNVLSLRLCRLSDGLNAMLMIAESYITTLLIIAQSRVRSNWSH